MVNFYDKYKCEGKTIRLIGRITIILRECIWIKRTILLISIWILFIPILIGIAFFTENYDLNVITPNTTLPSSRPFLQPIENQINSFSYKSRDPEKNYRPASFISFDNLSFENQKLGFFKTSLCKIIKIKDLELKFYQYNLENYENYTTSNSSMFPYLFPDSEDVFANKKDFADKVTKRFLSSADGWRVKFDLGNISEVSIHNFDYQVFHDTNLFFSAQSSKATVSYEKSGLILQGRAKISIEDGSTIAGNYIEWDIEKQLFYVKGVYVLTRNGRVMTGKDICIDAQLKVIEGQY